MQLVYIAGKYRGDVVANIAKARAAAVIFWAAGYGVMCPHLNSAHMDGIAPDQNFIEADLLLLAACDFIYLVPGWEESAGARIEKEFAEQHGILEIVLPE
jgi:hypothetical protein